MINKRKDHVYFYNDPDTDYEVDESKIYFLSLYQVEILDLILFYSVHLLFNINSSISLFTLLTRNFWSGSYENKNF